MGYWKKIAFEQQDLGFSSPSGRFVCQACVTDSHLAEVLAANLEECACSYCGTLGASDIYVLLEELSDVIRAAYTDPANELPYDTQEGGYQGQTYDGSELVEELDEWTNNEELLEEAADAFAGSDWCERDYFGLSIYQALSFGWAGFSDQVKHCTRFLFLQELGDDMGSPHEIPPGRMLDALGELFLNFELLSEVPKGTELVRARIVNAGERPSTAAELGTAPRKYAINPNRMSPAGIPMFYAAYDEATAVLETYQPNNDVHQEIVLARFRTERALRVIDLTSLPAMPSNFDRENREKRQPIAFLRDFERDLTQPVARDDRAHLEYVPTQVVTEFVRHRLRDAQGERLDGILYRSSHRRASKATVIFAETDQCVPSSSERLVAPEPLLHLSTARYAHSEEFQHLWESS